MARSFFHFGIIRKSIIKFLDIFDDIKIAKYNSTGSIEKYVEVPLKFMPKKKYYSWMYKRSHEKMLPIMGVQMTGIEYDETRNTSANENINITKGDDLVSYHPIGIPYNVSFELMVSSEYMSEMDQIAEQILPFFSPYVCNIVNIDDLDLKVNMDVLFEGASIDTDLDIPEEDYRNINWTFTFTAKTYLLKPSDSVKTVRKVVNKLFFSEESWDRRDTTTDMVSGGGSEDVELLVLGYKDDDNEIITKYERFE